MKKTSTTITLWARSAIAIVLLAISVFSATNIHAQTITLTSQEVLWVDANKCDATGPRGAWLSFTVTNSTANPLNNVVVTFAGFTGANASLFVVPSDLTRTFSTLAVGEVVPVYYYVDYSAVCTAPSCGGGCNFDCFTANYTLTVSSTGNPNVVRNGTVTTDCLLTAAAAGISQSSVLGPGYFVGQTFTQTVVYSFGNNTDLFFQPAGEAGFQDDCLRLIASKCTATSGGVTNILGVEDRLHFPTASVPGGGGTITIEYTWEVLCNNISQIANPWAAAKSGQKYKYQGFGASNNIPAATQAISISKSVSPTFLATATSDGGFGAGIAQWTVTLTNSGNVPIVVDKVNDVIPGCMTISDPSVPSSQINAVNSASEPSIGSTGMVSWTGKRPGDPANYEYEVPANGTLTLIYQTNVSGCASPASYTNSATANIGTTTVGPATATLNIGVVCTNPTVTTTNACIGGGNVTFTQSGGNAGGTWSVSGGGTIVPGTGVFTPTTAGCYTATYTTPTGGCTDSESFVVFPSAPSITAPSNTCNTAFSLPTVTAVSGFTVQYSINGGGYSTSPTIPTTPGCHTISARYVLTSACGLTGAGTAGTGVCAASNTVSVVIFPNAPTITAPANTCASAFTLPTVPAVAGFNIQYSINGGAYAASPTIPTTPGCHTITARYVLAADCGATLAGTAGSGLCGPSNTVSVVIFPTAPVITAPANTCASAFTLPTVAAVAGFNIQYSINGGAYAASPTIPTTPGCHTITARYVLAADCGATLAGTAGSGLCGPSNTVSVVIFPNAPVITAPANTCASAFTLPTVAAVAGFNIEYSINGGAYAASPTIPTTPGCHTITARYVLAADCGATLAGTAGSGLCGPSNTVSVVIFPTAPMITAPANTCASAFTLPTVAAVAGFNIQYSINGGAYAASPTIPTTPGCHTITARYVLAADCGATLAGTAGSGLCGPSNTVSVVIFPTAPVITAPANTCASAFTLPTVAAVAGFNIQYSINGGAYAASPTIPTTPGCHTITARYVLAADCGATLAGTAGSGLCGPSNTVSVVIFPTAPVITAPANTCASAFTLPTVAAVAGFNIQYSINGGAYAASPTIPTTPGCHTITARYVLAADCGATLAGTAGSGLCGPSNTVSVVIFPTAPVITAPANTCASAFTLPTVPAIAGFNIEYSINGGAYAASPTIPTTPGCHTITARYVLAADCGATLAGTAGSGLCGPSNTVSVVIFPTAPVISAPANTCASAFTLPTVPAVAGFNIEYSINGGAYAASPTIPTTPGCHTITARYVLAADCGATLAGTAGSGLCGPSNTVSVVIFPTAPVLDPLMNTCAANFSLPPVSPVAGFTIEYSIDGGAFTPAPMVNMEPGCHMITARYVLTADCGTTLAGTAGTGSCGNSNTIQVVVFPSAPVITAPANTCASAFVLPTVPAVANFNIEYSIDGGAFVANPTIPSTPGCHTITARYVLAADCVPPTPAGTPGTGDCGPSNTVSVVIFPNAPVITAPANTCASAFTLPTVAAVAGFNIEYSINGGAYAASPTIPTTPGCHTITARYVLAADCGATLAGTAGSGLCGPSNTVSVVIFPTAPVITAPANTCASAFSLPSVAAVAGFNIEYSINGGAYAASPTIPTTPGCHTITARYVLAADCGATLAGTAGSGLCGPSNTVSVVIFPALSGITVANTCNAQLIIPAITTVFGFRSEYSFDGGASWSTLNGSVFTTPGCYNVQARYVLIAACGNTAADAVSDGAACDPVSTNAVIFPPAPALDPLMNTCAANFGLPPVSPVAGFTIEYSIDGGAFTPAPMVNMEPGCHMITARYVLTADCGTTLAGTAGTGSCGNSNTIQVVVFPSAPVITAPANTCASAFVLPTVPAVANFNIEYSIDGGAFVANPTIPSTPGCHTITARYVLAADCVPPTPAGTPGTGDCGNSNTVSVVIFPNAPVITAPANTCASAFSLPSVAAVAGFTVEYSIDGGAYATNPTIPTTPGCHTIVARYVLTSTCGATQAGTAGTGACGSSNIVNVVIFPSAPTITAPANTCASAFSLPSVAVVPGFNVEYSINGGIFAASPTIPTTPGCHTIVARYFLSATCGLTEAGISSTGDCGASNTVSVVIFPNAPTITAPSNTCASVFSLPSVATVAGFNIEYSIDGGVFAASPTIPTTPGCHTIVARYVLAATCGLTEAGTPGTGNCGNSNTVSVVIFPNAPVIDPPANTCASAFTLPSVAAVAGFTVEYSIDGGAFGTSPTIPTTPGCHTIVARYVLTATCGATQAGTAGTGACGSSNTVSVVIFPNAPSIIAPANTCASAFTLPSVAAVAGFNIEYSIDGGVFAASPTIPTTPGCHTIVARYVLAATCGLTEAGTPGTGNCGNSNTVSVVIFPNAPTITAPANTCASAFTLPSVAAVAGFTVEYSIDGGAFGTSPTIPTTPGCHTIVARYVLTTTCGATQAGTAGTGACGSSNTVSVVIFPNAPSITAPANTCASAFTLPSVATVAGFNIEYSIDGGAYATSPTIPTTPGCHTIVARYVLAATCGLTEAGTPGTGNCGNSNTVSVVIFPNAPTITAPANTCASAFTLPNVAAVAGFTVEYSIDGGAFGTSPTIPTTPGCHTIVARYVLTTTCGATQAGTAGTGACGSSNMVSVVIFPNAPSITAPANTCASAFTLPSVAAVAGFNIEYSIDGGVFAASPTIPTTPGCHTIVARYVLAATCGLTEAGTPGTGNCGNSNTVSVVIFPNAPTITAPANTCASAFTLPSVAAVAGFTVEYSIDGGAFGTSPTIPTTPGCHTIVARYVLTTTCGATQAGTAGTGACGSSNTVSVVIFPNAPSIIAPANTCASAFTLPNVAAVAGFTVEYSIDGGAYATSPTIPTTPGCHTISARYVLTSTCGATLAGTAGTGACGASNTVNVVIFPSAPTITAPTNTCASAFSLPNVAVVAGFNVEYSIDGGAFAASPTIPSTPGCHTVAARYVLASTCGATLTGTAGTGACGASNTVSVVIFPNAPTITAPSNTCDLAFTLPSVAAVAGFTVQYSIDGGAYAANPTVPTSVGCHSIKARYVLTSTCGTTTAGTAGTGACSESNEVSVVIFPEAPVITAPSNTCAVGFALPSVPAISGFTVQYRIDGGAYSANPTIPTTPGCYSIQARYVLSNVCGLNTVGTAGTGDCGDGNVVYVVIYPAAPSLTTPANTCNTAFVLPSVSSVAGFDVEFSIDGGAYSGAPSIPTTPGCHSIRARYILENACGSTAEGSTGDCPVSNEVRVVIFPATPTLNITNTCGTALSFSNVPAVAGFNTVYDVIKPGGALVADNVDYATAIAALDNTVGTWTITVGYALASTCGSTPAGAESATDGCDRLTLTPQVYAPVVTNAGADLVVSVCLEEAKVTLAGSITGGATTGSWLGGNGTFTPDRNTLNAMYTPSQAEINAGSVTLTLQSADPEGPCLATSDQVKITIDARGVACHGDPINVSLNANCEFLVTPEIVLVNPLSQSGIYVLYVADQNGVAIPGNLLTGAHAGLTLKYYIRNNICGDECWGYIKVEDKQAPKLVNANFSNNPVYCFDANFVLNNPKTIGTPGIKSSPVQIPAGTIATGTVNDEVLNLGIATFTNCDPTCKITVKWSDRLETYPCDSINATGTWGRIYREWVATNCLGMRSSVTQVIVLKRPSLNQFAFTGAGKKDPEAPKYDWTVTYNNCSVDKSLIKKVDWMPRISSTFHMPPDLDRRFFLDEVECNYSVQIKDTEFPICNGKGVKIDRELYVFDWCKGGIVDTFHILIKIGDFEAPKLEYAHHAPYEVSTGPMDCTAAFPISVAGIKATFGVNIVDNCGIANVSVVVKTKDRYIKGFLVAENVWDKVDYAAMNGMIIGLPVGRHRLIIDAFDGCYNARRDSFEFNVVDKIAPVMKCDDDLHISLSNANGYTSGYAQVLATDIDENSTDNCKLAWIAVRRTIPTSCAASFIQKGYDTNGNGRLDATPFDDPKNAPANFDWATVDGFDLNGDGDIRDFGETFILKGGKLMSPLMDFVEFFCCDLAERVTVELWGADASGNRNYCWMDLLIEDKVTPTCIAPWDVTIDCDDKNIGLIDDKVASSKIWGDVTITTGNDCAALDTVYTVEKSLKCGYGKIVRKWTLSKGSITITCSQTIWVRPIHQYDICFPKDVSTDCKTPSPDTVIVDELACDLLAVNVTDKRYDATGDECYKIFRTYTVINWCAYDDKCGDPMTEDNVYVVDRATFGNNGKDPIYLLVRDNDRDLNEEFYLSKNLIPNESVDLHILGDDDRNGSASGTGYNSTPNGKMPYCEAYDLPQDHFQSWEYYHSFMYTQIIKVYDSERPVVTGIRDTFCTSPTACTANITKVVNLKDNCSDKVTLETQYLMIAPFQTTAAGSMILYSTPRWSTKDLGNGNFEISVTNLPEGTHDLIVVGRDECGNLSVATRIPFTVKDCKAPAPICINGLSTELMPDGNNSGMMTVWASDFVASKIYDCNGQGPETKDGLKLVTKYSINRVGEAVAPNKTSLLLTCADAGKVILVELHAWDEAGNHDFCVTFIEVQDNRKVCPGVDPLAGEISGVVATDDLEPLNGASLDLSGAAQMNQTTGSNGAYAFNNLTRGGDYTVTAQLDKNHLNGVSTFDLVLIQKHILGIESITNPYRLIAADVSNSKTVSSLDIIQIRKLILGIDAKYANVASWKFVDATYRFPDANNPWSAAFPEVVNVNDLEGKVKADFTAIKMGDVSGNASANGAVATEIRGSKDWLLNLDEQELQIGQTYEVVFRAKDLAQIQGFQFTLQVAEQAEIIGLDYGVMKAENFGVFATEGLITTSFHSTSALADEALLFTLKLKANTQIKLSEVLKLNSRLTNVEAYNQHNEVMGVQLNFSSKAISDQAALYQNTPNPFADETSIGFYLPKATRATLTVRDVKGALIYKVEGNYTKGNNRVTLKQEQLRASGVLYYTLETNDFTATQKMVLLNK